ncbi:MAG: hypothetical protein H6713_03005 [Myxococcales bacterium]|nr:hypothetical protein [Myxococcales bacterium]
MSRDAPVTARRLPSWGSHVAFALAALALMGAHSWLLFYFIDPAIMFGHEPMYLLDFDTHIAQTWRVLEGLAGWGKPWVYDVQLLAGQPAGVIFDADNKAWELWTYALWRLGLPRGLAFNSFVLLAHTLVAPTVYAAARLFGAARWPALAAATAGSTLWFFDSFAHWCWVVGMVAYSFAAYLSLIPLALFFRMLRQWRWRQGVGVALSLATCLLIHPYSFVILVFPMVALYGAAFRRLDRRQHLAVWAIALFAIVANSYWLIVAFRYWHYILDSAYFGQSGVEFLLADIGALLLDPKTSGFVGTRTGTRLLVLGAGVGGLLIWRRARDPRLLPFTVALVAMFALSYFGSYSHALAQIQPYRHVLPLMYLSLVPAAGLLDWLGTRRRRDEPRRVTPGAVLTGVLLLPVVQNQTRDVMYFMTAWIPSVAPLPDGDPALLQATGFVLHPDYRWRSLMIETRDIEQWVREHDDGQGRFLVEFPHLGDHLSWATDAQVLGGFTLRNLEHSAANLFRDNRFGAVPKQEFRAYLERYAVQWVIVHRDGPQWSEWRRDELDRIRTIGLHTIYRTRFPVNLVAAGGGRVEADTNLLTVTGTRPDQDVVLRYHWLETLECAPGCAITREPIEGDPVGFIRIPAPHPSDFTVVNGY